MTKAKRGREKEKGEERDREAQKEGEEKWKLLDW